MLRSLARPLLLGLGLALSAALGSCSSEAAGGGGGERSGQELYAAYCALCHGENGGGTPLNLGPSYRGIAQYWDAESLLEYIDDPQAYAKKVERLGQREMTAIPDDVTPEQRRRLVEHALSLMD